MTTWPMSRSWADPSAPVAVTLCGMELGTATPNAALSSWAYLLDDVVGWDTLADDATEATQHPSGDGMVSGMARRGGRQITLVGSLVGAQPWGAQSTTAALMVLGSLEPGIFTVADRTLGLTLESDVRLARILSTRHNPSYSTVTLSLVADDPLRYGSSQLPVSNGVLSLANRGSALSWPLLDLVGPHGALSIVHPGGTFTLAALSAGQSVTVDCRNGVVWSGGVRTSMGAGPWPRVPSGVSSWTVSGLSSGSAVLRRHEAWR